jgi:hypothetical protein
MTGGRPLPFSRRISGGNRSSEPFALEPFCLELMALSKIDGLVEENAEGANLPAIASRSGEAGGTPPQIRRRKDQAVSLGTEEKTLCPPRSLLNYLHHYSTIPMGAEPQDSLPHP